MEFCEKHRPTKLKDVLGQDGVIQTLNDFGRKGQLPRAILFSGPSGVGKTTIARILAAKLKCHWTALREMNVADVRGIDAVRKIREEYTNSPHTGDVIVYIFDEAHGFTSDAQNALLKVLEDASEYAYFILCTTDPNKLLKTIRTRCTEFALKPLGPKLMTQLLDSVNDQESEVKLPEEVRDKIIQEADGSPRRALVLLHKVVGVEDEDEQLARIDTVEEEHEGYTLAKALVKPDVRWIDVTSILKKIPDLEKQAEGIRKCVISYMSTTALRNTGLAAHACRVIDYFRQNFDDSGRAGLIEACHSIIKGRED
jgi:DNA polymerase-3 subunit gamma/tau